MTGTGEGAEAERLLREKEDRPGVWDATGSSECPVCGKDFPHGHARFEMDNWIDGQASRFGYRAMLVTGGAGDDFVDRVLKGLDRANDEWLSAYGWPRTDIQEIRALVQILQERSAPMAAEIARLRTENAAAPDLLAALQLAESVYRMNVVAKGEPSSVLDAMQAAIAKATIGRDAP